MQLVLGLEAGVTHPLAQKHRPLAILARRGGWREGNTMGLRKGRCERELGSLQTEGLRVPSLQFLGV